MTDQIEKFNKKYNKKYNTPIRRKDASNQKPDARSPNNDESSKPQTFSSFEELASLKPEEITSATPNSNDTGEDTMTQTKPKTVSNLGLDDSFMESEFFRSLGINSETVLNEDIEAQINDARAKFEASNRQSSSHESGEAASTNTPAADREGNLSEGERGEEAASNDTAENKPDTDTITFESREQSGDDWRKEYNEILSKYAEEKAISWERTPDDTYEGLKGKLDDVEMNFPSPKEAVIHTQDASEEQTLHTAEALLQIAKEKNLVIPYHEEWSDKLKAAMEQLRQENPEYFIEFPVREKPNEETREETNEETNDAPQPNAPEYKLYPKFAKPRIELYYGQTQNLDDRIKLDERIKKEKKLLAEGKYKVTGEDKAKGEILMMQYAHALNKGDTKTANDCITALKRYGIENIERVPNTPEGAFRVIAGDTYSHRSPEEQQQIDQATERLLGKPNDNHSQRNMQQQKPNEGR